MRHVFLSALLLFPAAAALAGDPPKIAGEAKLKPYVLVKLSVKDADPKAGLLWKVRPQDGANAGKVQWASSNSAPEIVWVAPPGKYLVEVVVIGPPDAMGRFSIGGDELLVEIESPGPPPAPPAPPKPDSPLRSKLRTAHAQDAGDQARKEKLRADLAELYRQAVKLAQDATVTTTEALATRVKEAGVSLSKEYGPDFGKALRTAVADEVAAALADGPLTPDSRTAAASLFTRIADALNW